MARRPQPDPYISFFPEFFQLWVSKLENHDHGPVNVRIDQFKREIPVHRFRQKLDELLVTSFNIESLQQFLAKNSGETPFPRPMSCGRLSWKGYGPTISPFVAPWNRLSMPYKEKKSSPLRKPTSHNPAPGPNLQRSEILSRYIRYLAAGRR